MSEVLLVTAGYESLLAAHGLRGLPAFFAWDQGQCLSKNRLETWRERWRIVLGDGRQGERTFYLKRFDHPPFRRQLERWRGGHLRLSTAGIEWDNARQLAERGIRASEPVAFGHDMLGGWERRSFILLHELAGESLERWVPVHVPPTHEETDWPRRRRCLDGLARFVAKFHAAGFVHRDLYLSHVFILPATEDHGDEPDKASVAYGLIDLQRVFRPRWRQRRWVVKDLAALNFSSPRDRIGRRDRLRFLCRYAQSCGRFGSARQLARWVEGKTARMARRVATGLATSTGDR